MFDLSLAHIHRAERERDLAADLRDRQILKAAAASRHRPTATAAPARRPRCATGATRVRALGR